MNMIRKEIELNEAQWRRLEALAAETGRTVDDLVRECVAERVETGSDGGEGSGSAFSPDELDEDGMVKDWKAGLRKLGNAWAERDDMREFVRDLRSEHTKRIERLAPDKQDG